MTFTMRIWLTCLTFSEWLNLSYTKIPGYVALCTCLSVTLNHSAFVSVSYFQLRGHELLRLFLDWQLETLTKNNIIIKFKLNEETRMKKTKLCVARKHAPIRKIDHHCDTAPYVNGILLCTR